MKDYNYKSYKRIHKYSNASDIEEGKISKEKSNYKRYQKKSERLMKRIENLQDPDLIDSLTEEFDTFEHASKKEINNARVHKKRLNNFKQYDDFDN